MILLIDAGNSAVKACQLLKQGFSTPAILDQKLLSQAHGGRAIISCVTSLDKRELLASQLQSHDIEAEWLRSPNQGLGLTNSYPEPGKLGVDRFLALAAGFKLSRGACVVVDAGTAITVDVCDDHGKHLGGLIAPGLTPLSQALRDNTALPWIDDELDASTKFADSTKHALQLGALQSAAGLIEHAYKNAQQQHPHAPLLLTGGSANTLKPLINRDCLVHTHLVFEGIEIYARRAGW